MLKNKDSKMDEMLVLVDAMDKAIGSATKTEVHAKGLLHRAFSIFIFNSRGELLLQRRAKTKYHSAGLWTNTCCGHPLQNESIIDAARRRLKEEMNMSVPFEEICSFQYKAEFDNGLIENEIDHIYYGVSDVIPYPNLDEVDEWKYISPAGLVSDVIINAEDYTAWFKIVLKEKLLGELINY
jgi:isopentenyl-diphosphate delta-isomerase